MNMRSAAMIVLATTASLLTAQTMAPVVGPRGIVNAFTLEPSPSTVGAGGIIWIQGLNLGPAAGAQAAGDPLPTTLGDPPVQVLINGTPAPLYAAAPERIVAQVPWETPAGLAQVVVKRGDLSSRPARVQVNAVWPSLRSSNKLGFGEALLLSNDGASIALSGTGFGRTNPHPTTGSAGPQDTPAVPVTPVRAYVGGLPANGVATLSPQRVGEFDIKIDLPPGAQPGDILSVVARRAANRLTFGTLKGPNVSFLPLPDGLEITGLTTSDLRGGYVLANGARDDNGCYPSYLFDIALQSSAKVDGCLLAANRAAPSPGVAATDGAALAAFAGPPASDGVSAKVMVFSPAGNPMKIDLPGSAIALTSSGGDFVALLSGTPPKGIAIDSNTGEIRDIDLAGAIAGGTGAGAGAALNALLGNLKIDLGNGLTHLLAIALVPQGAVAVVGDDADAPKAAKLAQLDGRGEVTGTRDFPAGWLPLLAAKAPTAGAGNGGAAGPGALSRPRGTAFFEQVSRTVYVLARAADASKDAVIAFGPDNDSVIPLPDSWFVTSCTLAIPVQQLTLTRRFSLLASPVAETDFKQPCTALGFVLFDYATQSTTVIPLPGDGQMVATAANTEVNDYLYGTNTDPSRRNMADTMFVLDGVTSTAFRMDLPSGVTSFANVQPVPEMSVLVALATNRTAGDAGIVLFDLDSGSSRLYPTPDGFASVQLLDVFVSTRKLLARGVKSGADGSQFLIYDLLTGDLTVASNPPGVAYVGGLTATGGGAGGPGGGGPGGGAPAVQLQRVNAKANAITAVTYNSDRKQNGVMLLRVP